jgi:hypothetical protein
MNRTVRRFPQNGFSEDEYLMIIRQFTISLTIALFATGAAAKAIDAQQPARVPVSVLERYVGEWVYPDGETMKVLVKDETLWRQVPGQTVPYIPLYETLFRIGPVFTAEFVIDGKGGASQILTDGTVEFRLTRKGSPPAAMPPSPPPVKLSMSILERYVGVYEYIPGQMKRTDLRIIIRLEGDKLVRSVGGDQVLTPISETRFRVGGTSQTVDFVVDEAGVTQVSGTGFQQLLARLTSKK